MSVTDIDASDKPLWAMPVCLKELKSDEAIDPDGSCGTLEDALQPD